MQENDTAVFEDEMEYSVPSNAAETVKRLWNVMGKQRIRLIIVAVSVLFYTVLSVAAPLYSAGIVDLLWGKIRQAWGEGAAFRVSWESGGREIIILLVIYTVTGILYTFQSFLMASFAERLSLELRTMISRKLNRLPLSYFDSHRTGEVLSRITNDLDKMSEVLQTGLLKLFTAVGMVAGSLVMMLRFHIGLTLVFLLFTGIAIFSTKIFAAKTFRYAGLRQQAVSRVTGQVEEAYSGRTVIRAFGREEKSTSDMRDAVEELARTSRNADFMMNAVNPFIRFVNRLGQAVIAVSAGKLLLDGVLTVGTFQAFFQYVYQASEPLTEAAYMVNSLQSSIASVERIFELLDGTDLSLMSYEGLRKYFGMVLQDTWLFEGTIAENIAYGKPDASREEIVAAAKAARADFFIRTLPQGYDTILGSDAENISAGQKQLLTIARVMLCNPAVLILDEATSSVDTRTEMEIGKAMQKLMEKRTSFVIAHRLSTIVDADLILVMQNGTIIEKGNHRELLRFGGVYADLYNSQFAG